ncbi:MAG: hypothetical protein GC159_07850 [Phycisphaera sp.]|nr:hypothetical protein [Phycisphaera sp.]
MNEVAVAKVYVKSQQGDRTVVNLPGTQYQIRLCATGKVEPTAQGRAWGVIRVPVWKLDLVSNGGAFVEPVFGRPRRVQGEVIATLPETNSVVVLVAGQPIVGDLPERWQASQIAVGTRVGLDCPDGATFSPAQAPAAV